MRCVVFVTSVCVLCFVFCSVDQCVLRLSMIVSCSLSLFVSSSQSLPLSLFPSFFALAFSASQSLFLTLCPLLSVFLLSLTLHFFQLCCDFLFISRCVCFFLLIFFVVVGRFLLLSVHPEQSLVICPLLSVAICLTLSPISRVASHSASLALCLS